MNGVWKRSRVVLAGIAVAGLGLMLAACSNVPGGSVTPSPTPTPSVTETPSPTPSGTPTPTETPTPTPTPTIFSDLSVFTVTGDFNTQPTVTAAWPLAADQTLNEVLIAGTGRAITDIDWVTMQYTGYNATTGQVFDSSFNYGTAVPMQPGGTITGFANSMAGKHVGDRVLMAITGADGYDSQGGNANAGINVGDTLVFVVDIIDAQLTGPSGEPVTPPAGLPVVTDNNGTPSVTVPSGLSAPANLQVQTLIRGTGQQVTAQDAITVNYLEVGFDDGTQYASTYGKNPETGLLNVLIPGWQQGLVGQTVGSRVLLVVPPALAYPNGDTSSTPTLAPGVTLVYVVDILFTQVYGSA